MSTDVGYITYVEVELENFITPEHFAKFYTVLREEAKNITPENTSIRELCIEEGRWPTTVETFKFPLVSERFAVLTAYNIPNYKGIQGGHLYLASSRGNKDK